MALRPDKQSIRAYVVRQQKRRLEALRKGRPRVVRKLTEREIRESAERWNNIKHDVPTGDVSADGR